MTPTSAEMGTPTTRIPGPGGRMPARVLLLCQDPAWRAAVESEARIVGRQGGARGVVLAASARDALQHLAAEPGYFSHLLLEPAAAGDLLDELLSLSSGEAGPGPALVLLGAGRVPPAVAERLAVTVNLAGAAGASEPGWLGRALEPWAAPGHAPPRGLTNAADLRAAIEGGCARVLYQPMVRLDDRRPVGMEALARLEHPVLGRLAPEFFLPGMEAAGLLRELSRAVVANCLADWDGARLAELDLRLSINLPLDILVLDCLPGWLDAQMRAAGMTPSRILLELTETQLVTDLPALETAARRLRGRGYRLAIDDVGPTLRDPAELLALPFSSLKLDKSIVRESADSPEARDFLRRAVEAAHAAGMAVVAEGIEDAEIWARMRSLGVECGQGYAIARPLPAVAVPLWHHAWMADTQARIAPAP